MKLFSFDRNSLSFKLILWLACSSVALVVIVALINTHFVQLQYKDMEREKITTIMDDALKTLGINMSYEFKKAVEDTGRQLLNNRDIILVKIIDSANGEKYIFSDPEYNQVNSSFTRKVDIKDPTTGTKIGTLEVAWSRLGYKRTMANYYRKLLILVAVYLVFVLVMVRIISGRLAPLRKLADQMRRFSPEEPAIDIEIRPGEKDEVALIAEAAKTMLKNIRDYSKRLENLNRELTRSHEQLEKRVEERTRELKEKQAQLAHAGRLVALGELAAGIAHELGQPLQIIKSASEIISEEIKEDSISKRELVNMAGKISLQVNRAFSIITGMRTFARHDNSTPPEIISPRKPLVECINFFHTQFRHHGINIKLDIADNIPKIKTEYQKFQQIVVNLLSNARYAIQNRTDPDEPGTITIKLSHDAQADTVTLEIIDNGTGMSPSEKEHCLEPFFTTKEPDEGTGLGLSIVYGLLKEFGFRLEIESEPGIGSSFKVIMKAEHDSSIEN